MKRGTGKIAYVFLVVSFLSLLAFLSTATAKESADLVLMRGKVITVDRNFTTEEAVAVKDGKIIFVGKNKHIGKYLGEKTKVIDLRGKTVLPGVNDGHGHEAYYGGSRPPATLDLVYPSVTSIADIQALLATRVTQVESGQWIRGNGWDTPYLSECQGKDPDICLTKEQLDSVSPDNPVVFTDFSAHNIWVNSKALELAGITKDTPDPPGGVIVRDAGGNPTGLLREFAATGLVMKVVPLWTKAELREAIVATMKTMNANGITSYTEAALGPGGNTFNGGVLGEQCIEVYKDLYNEGNLTARVTINLLFGEYGAGSYQDLKNGVETYAWPQGFDSTWLRFPTLKIFADGIPITRTSWMWEPYVGGDFCGSLTIPGTTDEEKYNELIDMIVYGHSKGFQIGVHATGDRAIGSVVDGFIKAQSTYPWLRDRRHYIIHGDFITPSDCERAAKHGIGVNMQPYIQSLIADIEPMMVGPERAAYEWPFRTALDAGISLTFSSDTPITFPNWRQGVQSAILRQAVGSGNVSGPGERITRQEAIRAYTINGAWQDHMERLKGSIEVGKLADFCILGEDILTVDAEKIQNIPVLMTIVGGKIVYEGSAELWQ